MASPASITDEYIDSYKATIKTLRIALAAGAGLLVLALLAVFFLSTKEIPEPKPTALTCDGRVIPMPTIDEAYFLTNSVVSFTQQVVPLMYSFNFDNFDEHVQSLTSSGAYRHNPNAASLAPGGMELSSAVVTQRTADKWLSAVKKSGLYSLIINESRVARAELAGQPRVVKEGLLKLRSGKEVYRWIINVPIEIRATNQKDTRVVGYNVRTTIVRTSIQHNPRGYIIGAISALPLKNNGGR